MNLTRDAPHRGHLRGNTVFTTSRWQVKHCQVVEVSAARVRSAPVLSVIQGSWHHNEFEFDLAVESAAHEFALAVERLRPFSPGLLALDLAGPPPISIGTRRGGPGRLRAKRTYSPSSPPCVFPYERPLGGSGWS